jgi:hypothetical protein
MRDDDVLAQAEAFALQHAASSDQRELLQAAFRGRRAALEQNGTPLDDHDCVYVPRWVYAAVTGDDTLVAPLTVAACLLWSGIDLLDAVMDGDPLPDWRGYRPAAISLAAVTLISAVAPLALATLDAPPATVVAMQQTLCRGLLAMSAGQQRDVAMAGSDIATVEAVEAAVIGKSGEGLAMLAALAAQFGGAEAEDVAAYAGMGRALGTARQLQSDCYDLFVDTHSKDLANGTRTLPIAWRLQNLAGDERDQFVTLLDRARIDPAARDDVRACLMATGAVWGCSVLIELHCERARQALARARPMEQAALKLHRRIDEASFAPARDKSEGGWFPMTNQSSQYDLKRLELIERLLDYLLSGDKGPSQTSASATAYPALDSGEYKKYGELIEKFSRDRDYVTQVRECVSRYKDLLAPFGLDTDAYVLTVLTQKIDWTLPIDQLQAEAVSRTRNGPDW